MREIGSLVVIALLLASCDALPNSAAADVLSGMQPERACNSSETINTVLQIADERLRSGDIITDIEGVTFQGHNAETRKVNCEALIKIAGYEGSSPKVMYSVQPTVDGNNTYVEVYFSPQVMNLVNAERSRRRLAYFNSPQGQEEQRLARCERLVGSGRPNELARSLARENDCEGYTEVESSQKRETITNGISRFSIIYNANGAVLQDASHKIYLGKECDAQSTIYGSGVWGQANGGMAAHFGSARFSFTRQNVDIEGAQCDTPSE